VSDGFATLPATLIDNDLACGCNHEYVLP
jgi:hypothetical protein